MKTFITKHPIVVGSISVVLAITVVVSAVLAIDIRALNQDETIDWDTKELTDVGFREPGILFDFELDCTTGQLRAHTPFVDFDVMTVDPPWVAKHKTDDACRQHGFDPDF